MLMDAIFNSAVICGFFFSRRPVETMEVCLEFQDVRVGLKRLLPLSVRVLKSLLCCRFPWSQLVQVTKNNKNKQKTHNFVKKWEQNKNMSASSFHRDAKLYFTRPIAF